MTQPRAVESPLVRLLADVGVVVAAVTAVLYYFGWVRTRFQARELGFDVSALSLTTTDYVLKSLNVLFLPLILLLAVILVGYQAHRQWVVPAIERLPVRTVLRAARLLGWAWVPLAVVALILLATPVAGYAMPVTLTASVLLARYGRSVRQARSGTDPWPMPTRVIAVILLALAVFWCTERVARTTGEAFGRDFAADPGQLPAVVVFSAKDLRLAGPGVTRTVTLDPQAAYQFEYRGLYLLERSGDRYFFITIDPGRVIVLTENDTLRMEFTARR
ncbi:hypothetical protein [Winogradskya humida]|uniref:Uncharacterized protein n=1 Tax=Winogradskya humida TaxID=113566 RepID=A0ABQ3ZJK8_9ACTN|nr:hypothetical protein [Actinoplanes humidus]GIE18775.1 hypothetical protein Ahu01nite_018770 [Actinoplanes humidus]